MKYLVLGLVLLGLVGCAPTALEEVPVHVALKEVPVQVVLLETSISPIIWEWGTKYTVWSRPVWDEAWKVYTPGQKIHIGNHYFMVCDSKNNILTCTDKVLVLHSPTTILIDLRVKKKCPFE